MKQTREKSMKNVMLMVFGLMLCFFMACSRTPEVSEDESQGPVVLSSYEDTVILVSSDHVSKSLTFQNIETGRRYTLTYDGVTDFADKYGTAMAAIQLKNGAIADISFVKESKTLKSLQYSKDYFVLTDVTFEDLIKKDTRMNMLGEEYRLDDYLVIASENETMERMELYKGDMLTVYGKDHTIYSMHLQSGHGFLRLKNDMYFINGWIEVGNKAITKITENMLLTLPEGKYDILVSNEGISGEKQVTIGRNQEVTLDLGDIEHEVKYGNVLFVLNPSYATLFIDGKKADASAPVSLEYGIHQLICRADGYDTLSSYIKVGDAYASVTLSLTSQREESGEENSEEPSKDNVKEDESKKDSSEKKEDEGEVGGGVISENESQSSEKESESESPSENVSEITPDLIGKIYIDAPEGVEVYVDGEYIGTAPVAFVKKDGTVVVTLRKNGYQTRSYTLRMEQSEEDIHYSFSELTPS